MEEQIDYYRARAPEYDDWWLRTGRYEPDDDFGRRWEAGKDELEDALRGVRSHGRRPRARGGNRQPHRRHWRRSRAWITSRPSTAPTKPWPSPARRSPTPSRVTFVHTDLFTWRPPRQFDVVAFGFWLSHVPPQRFEAFWRLVRDALRPDGRVFFVDNAVPIEQAATANGRQVNTPWSQTWLDQGVSLRTLADGRRVPHRQALLVPRRARAGARPRSGGRRWCDEHQQLFIHGAASSVGLEALGSVLG